MASPTTSSSQISPTATMTQRTQSSRGIHPSQATTDARHVTKTRSSQSTSSRKMDDDPKSFETHSNDSTTNDKILQSYDYDNIRVVICKQSEDYKLCYYDKTSTSLSKIDDDVLSQRKHLLWEINLNSYIHDCDRKSEKIDDSAFKIYFATAQKSSETSKICDSEMDATVLNLESDVFGVLFGNDAKILKSSVLILCISGMVYYKALKTLGDCLNTKLNLLCETKSDVIGMHSLTIPLQLNESTNLHTDDYNARRNCLIIVSKNGKCFLIYESESSETIYQPFELFSSILLTTSDGKNLFYSTRSDVYKISFKSQETIEGNNEYRNIQFDFDSTPLGYSGMKKLNVSYKDGNLQLIGQSGNGRKYLIDISPTNVEKEKPPLLKDLLIGIKQTEVVLNERNREIDELNSLLAELSLASHIVAEFYNEAKSNREKENGVSSTEKCDIENGVLDRLKCDVKCMCEDLGSRQNYAVMCTLTNNSPASFSSNWSLVVRLIIYENLERVKIQKIKSQTSSFTQGFTPQQFESVKFSLESSWLAQPVFDVDVVLTYNIAILDTPSCVSVPIKRVSVDLFDLLRSNKNSSRNQSKVSKNLTDLTNNGIVRTLSQLRGQNSREIQTSLEKSQNQVISVAVDLSAENDGTPLTLTELVSSCLSPPSLNQPSCTMYTPSGDVISFEVTDTRKLMMRCTNVAVLCQLRQAMERRYHSEHHRIETMTVKQARDSLKKLQELQWSLSASPMETNQGTEWRDVMDKVVAAYQTLRS